MTVACCLICQRDFVVEDRPCGVRRDLCSQTCQNELNRSRRDGPRRRPPGPRTKRYYDQPLTAVQFDGTVTGVEEVNGVVVTERRPRVTARTYAVVVDDETCGKFLRAEYGGVGLAVSEAEALARVSGWRVKVEEWCEEGWHLRQKTLHVFQGGESCPRP